MVYAAFIRIIGNRPRYHDSNSRGRQDARACARFAAVRLLEISGLRDTLASSISLNWGTRDALPCPTDRLRTVIVRIGMNDQGGTVSVQKCWTCTAAL